MYSSSAHVRRRGFVNADAVARLPGVMAYAVHWQECQAHRLEHFGVEVRSDAVVGAAAEGKLALSPEVLGDSVNAGDAQTASMNGAAPFEAPDDGSSTKDLRRVLPQCWMLPYMLVSTRIRFRSKLNMLNVVFYHNYHIYGTNTSGKRRDGRA